MLAGPRRDARLVDNEKPHTLVASFYDVENFTSARLLLNNKDIVTREIRPTLHGENGGILEIAPVTVEPNSFKMIDLKEWAALGGAGFQRGSIRLFHTGKDLVIGSEVYLEDDQRSLNFEEKLHEIGTFDSRRLEGVMYIPTQATQGKLIISNTGESSVNVTAKFSRMPRRAGDTQTFFLLPHQTKVIDLTEQIGDPAEGGAIGVSITHDGDESSLLARALVYDSEKGYSLAGALENPSSKKSSELHGAGFKLENVGDEKLKPVVVVRNVGEAASKVEASIPYTRRDGTTNTITLPGLRLRAGEMALIDVRKVSKTVEAEEIRVAGLEISYDTEPGSIIAEAQSIGENVSQVYGMMLWDVLSHRSSTGGYPFYIEGTSTTRAYIKNGTDREMDYVAYLVYGNGEQYMIGLRRLGAHQTVEIDVKAIRDNQIPDETGKVLPVGTVRGQIQWTVRARAGNERARVPENLGLIGQSEQHDAERRMNSTYYCENCCPGSYAWSIILPTNSEVAFEVGKVIAFVHIEVQDNCYGNFYQFDTTSRVSWSSTLTSVAITSGNVVTVIGAGTAQIKATFVATAWAAIPCLPGEETPFAEETIAVDTFGAGRDDVVGELDFISTFARRQRGPSDWSVERLAQQELRGRGRGPSAEVDFMLMPRSLYRTTASSTSHRTAVKRTLSRTAVSSTFHRTAVKRTLSRTAVSSTFHRTAANRTSAALFLPVCGTGVSAHASVSPGTTLNVTQTSVASITASIPSTKNPVTNTRPDAGVFTTTNVSMAFATGTSPSNAAAVFKGSDANLTITATGVKPASAAASLKWKIDRDPADTGLTGTPILSTATGSTLTITPNTSGNFRLISFFDTNTNGSYDAGEELRVLRLVIVEASIVANSCKILTNVANPNDQSTMFKTGGLDNHVEFVKPISIMCDILLKSGGSNRLVGLDRVQLGVVGNLTDDNFTVHHPIEVPPLPPPGDKVGSQFEAPNGRGLIDPNQFFPLPMLDTIRVMENQEPVGGDSAFRFSSTNTNSSPIGGGRLVKVEALDSPKWSWSLFNQTTGNRWETTTGTVSWREYFAGYTHTFIRTYVVMAQGDWRVVLAGTSDFGDWTPDVRAVIEVVNPVASSITGNAPKNGDLAGIQVLGRSFAVQNEMKTTP